MRVLGLIHKYDIDIHLGIKPVRGGIPLKDNNKIAVTTGTIGVNSKPKEENEIDVILRL